MNYAATQMRRKDKEITDRREIEEILAEARICRIALVEKNKPYIVPVNFGFKNNTLFFHSAPKGKKIEILKVNNNACFEVDIDTKLIKDSESLCSGTMKYKSVIGWGKAEFIKDPLEKKKALDVILKHYLNGNAFDYDDRLFKRTTVIKIKISEMTGKKS